MSKVIEIYDSEDESPQIPPSSESATSQPIDVPLNAMPTLPNCMEDAVTAPVTAASGSVSPPPLIIFDVTSINTSPLPTTDVVQGSPIATTSSTSAVSTASTSNACAPQQTKRSRRKSHHHPLCASPEIEFETIALDDDDDIATNKPKTKNTSNSKTNTEGAAESKSHKSQKPAPKAGTSSVETQLTDALNEFLISDETKQLLRQIAEDRVKINFLLASYNMPEIQFSLYSKSEVLQFQLDERIKSRRNRFIDQAKQLKKRRDMLQNSTARTSTS
ncbi:uncharacterized protein [Eurosta solidaginis]|uniref:uncharacterized protein n=1 Tax=Eurosta solidaginis TaxID=178769 RepID=UPI003530D73A